jgi:BirA family transcriptional regulator, biotin operon repressor / biotin---[acetyl-CoA-carboxylase] ligase
MLPGYCGPMTSDLTPLDPTATEAAVRAAADLGRVAVVERTDSTSSDVVAGLLADPASWPDRSVLVTDHQVAGRGRRGRTWTTPPHTAVTFSVVLRPDPREVPVDRWGWIPLLAGLAVVEALDEVAGVRAVLKWPNDVLVETDGEPLPAWGRRRKVAGVLGDLVAVGDGRAAVVGIGINVEQDEQQLPVDSATSLALIGDRRATRDMVLAAVVRHLVDLDARWRSARGDAAAAGLADRCAAVCASLGEPVRVELPGDRVLQGVARSLGADGSLEVVDDGGQVHPVLAGDVHHVRTVL